MEHFVGSPPPACEECGRQIDLWRAARNVMRWQTADFLKLALVGAVTQFLSVYLEPGETASVDLEALGVSADARILDITYSEGKGFRPLEIHDGYQPVRRKFPRRYLLHALPDSTRASDTDDMLISVTSMPAGAGSTPIYALVEAVYRFCVGDVDLVPVLAHAANEQGARALTAKALRTVLPGERAEDFARSSQMRDVYLVLLPLAARMANVPELDPYVVGLVEGLRKLRNPLAHSASAPLPDRQLLADQLTASVFLLNYLHFVAEALDRPVTTYPPDHPVAVAIREALRSTGEGAGAIGDEAGSG
jgi:hypothetical protein